MPDVDGRGELGRERNRDRLEEQLARLREPIEEHEVRLRAAVVAAADDEVLVAVVVEVDQHHVVGAAA